MLKLHTLVLYKSKPAIVVSTGAKPEIALQSGQHIKVREKDVRVLHPGPVEAFSELKDLSAASNPADVQELLAGTQVTLAELCEWLYDEFSPASAWAAWQLVVAGLYFNGTPDQITIRTTSEVEAERAARAAKEAEKQAWLSFLQRAEQRAITADDELFLRDTVRLAQGVETHDRVLRALKIQETPENAHKFLLEAKIWPPEYNPHPLRFGLPMTQPDALPLTLPEENRLDLTHLEAFAIDDAGSSDPDDAISVDGEQLWVHIADVAALVPDGSAADEIARARAANLYLPDKTIAMLPAAATEILALGLSEVSPALSFAISIEEDGTPTCMDIRPSWVRVTRLSYRQAEEMLDTPELLPLWHIAQRARARRIAQGAIELELPEVKVRTDAAGMVEIRPLLPLRSRTLVREAMLLCGEALARFGTGIGLPLPFSVQPPPDFDGDFPDGLAGMFARRMQMKPATVKTSAGSHAGLGLSHYTQVTSPLRRYGDLLAHQQLRRYLRGDDTLSAETLLARLAAIRDVAADVKRAERLSNLHWKLIFFRQNPDWSGRGVVVETQGNRHTILLPELDFEFKKQLRKSVPLNGTVTATVKDVDLPQLQAFFSVK